MDDYPGSSLGIQLLVILILTSINAFFAAVEMAVVSINKNTVREKAEDGNTRAIKLKKLLEEPTRFLSTIQVGITLAGYLSSATAATTIAKRLGGWFMARGIFYGPMVAVVAITIALSYFTLVFGELVPKRIALLKAEKIALGTAGIVTFISTLFKPFVAILSGSTKAVLTMTGNHSDDIEARISEEEIKSYIKVGQEQGLINSAGEEMLISIFTLDDKSAYEIMTPRTNVFMIDYDDFTIDMIEEMVESGFSRIPIYKDSYDNILGTIYLKDLFVNLSNNNYKKVDLDQVMKEPYFVPESKKIDTLLKELQQTKNYMAILIDEYGGFAGIVTVEDIVEEIVGEIEDEYDEETLAIQRIDETHYIIDGSVDIDDVNEELELEMESENHETMSGLLIELLGFIPDEEDDEKYSVVCDDNKVKLTVIKVKDRRVEQLELTIMDEQELEENQN
ncbi:MAG: HlyC/CorC family transporter [Tissierellia bacterium]|nr:HlyC/CorC family transporter [Tissierellia bacterium]